CGQRLVDQVDAARAGVRSRFPNGAPFDLRGTIRHADQYAGHGSQKALVVHFANKMLEHFLGDGEVCDDTVLQRADGLNMLWCASQHALCIRADGLDALATTGVGTYSDNRWFVEYDAVVAC